MNSPKKTETEEVIEKISNLKGPNKAERGALLLMESAFANQDARRQNRMAGIADDLIAAFRKAFPNLERGTLGDVVGDVVADLASLWNLREKLDKDLKKVFRMRFPQHRDHLHSFLIDIEVRQLDEASYLIRRLRKRLPILLKALDRQERTERRHRRAKPSENAEKLAVSHRRVARTKNGK